MQTYFKFEEKQNAAIQCICFSTNVTVSLDDLVNLAEIDRVNFAEIYALASVGATGASRSLLL